MTGCAAYGCKNRHRKDMRMFRFPTDPNRRKLWEMQVKRQNWTPGQGARLCQAHFEADQFENNRQDGWKRLKLTAIPTLFAHLTPHKQRKPQKKRKSTEPHNNDEKNEPDHTYTKSPRLEPHMFEALKPENEHTPPAGHLVGDTKPLKSPLKLNPPKKSEGELGEPTRKTQRHDHGANRLATLGNCADPQVVISSHKDTPIQEEKNNRPEKPIEVRKIPHNPSTNRDRNNSVESNIKPESESLDVEKEKDHDSTPLSTRLSSSMPSSTRLSTSPPASTAQATCVVEMSPSVGERGTTSPLLEKVKQEDSGFFSSDLPVCVQLSVPPTTYDYNEGQVVKLRAEVADLKQRLRLQEEKHTTFYQNIGKLFNPDQILALASSTTRGHKWSIETIKRASRIRIACGASGYDELLAQGYPLPSRRTLRRQAEGISIDNECLKDIVSILKSEQEPQSEQNTTREDCGNLIPNLHTENPHHPSQLLGTENIHSHTVTQPHIHQNLTVLQMPRNFNTHAIPNTIPQSHTLEHAIPNSIPHTLSNHTLPNDLSQNHATAMPRSDHHTVSRNDLPYTISRNDLPHTIRHNDHTISHNDHTIPRSDHHTVPRNDLPHTIPRSEHHTVPRNDLSHTITRSDHHTLPRNDMPHTIPRSEHHTIPRNDLSYTISRSDHLTIPRNDLPHTITRNDHHTIPRNDLPHTIPRSDHHTLTHTNHRGHVDHMSLGVPHPQTPFHFHTLGHEHLRAPIPR